MDNSLRLRALYTVGIHMTHNVMAHFLLARFCHIVVDIRRMAFSSSICSWVIGSPSPFLSLPAQSRVFSRSGTFISWEKNVLHLACLHTVPITGLYICLCSSKTTILSCVLGY